MIYILIAILLGYAFGCVHGSQIVGKYKNVDIKNSGVKNAGASNTTIVLGWKYGVIVGLVDIFKATIAIVIMRLILHYSGSDLDQETQNLVMYLTGFLVVIGHNYPATMKFKGGKGTASVVGMFLALDWKIALISIILLVAFTFVTDYLVVGVLMMYISFIVTTYYFDFGTNATLIAAIMTVLSFVKHLENYQRILNNKETKISDMTKKRKK